MKVWLTSQLTNITCYSYVCSLIPRSTDDRQKMDASKQLATNKSLVIHRM